MMWEKLHHAQQIGNKCAVLKPAIGLAERTSLTPSDEYSNYFRFLAVAGRANRLSHRFDCAR